MEVTQLFTIGNLRSLCTSFAKHSIRKNPGPSPPIWSSIWSPTFRVEPVHIYKQICIFFSLMSMLIYRILIEIKHEQQIFMAFGIYKVTYRYRRFCRSWFCQFSHFHISQDDEIWQAYQGPNQIKLEVVVSLMTILTVNLRKLKNEVFLAYERLIGS